MRVKRDFDEIYTSEADPWAIGDAASERYDLYRARLLDHVQTRGAVLDIGCGLGAFLARLSGDFETATGLDASPEAIRRAREQHPDIDFHVASADDLGHSPANAGRYDAIVYSDVIYYLAEHAKRESLAWVAGHLNDGGVALVAAWCPGGRYLEPDELRHLVTGDLRIVEEQTLESGHSLFVAERKRRLVSLTFDYETWHPIPEGKEIDWERDVFAPADALLDELAAVGARATFFAELGEYLWLREHEPRVAARWDEQLRRAASAGHEVGLHLHPSWLPELDARRDGHEWWWDWSRAKADDYPGDLNELIRRCKDALEAATGMAVHTFRAGAYQAQPFRRLSAALVAAGIHTDSSVYRGGVSDERGYDYSLAFSAADPYFASAYDPQLKAPPAERGVLELPITTFAAGDRLLLDGSEGDRFAERLLDRDRERRDRRPTSEQLRRAKRWRGLIGLVYVKLAKIRPLVTAVAPRRLLWAMSAPTLESEIGHEYVVAIGHTKGDLHVSSIARGVRALADAGYELVTLAESSDLARRELESSTRDSDEERAFQVRREYRTVLGSERNERQSHELQARIPLDRTRVLDLGCGAGHWSARIAGLYPWMTVVGVDAGADFVARARELYDSERVSFLEADFQALPFEDGSFDCVYADNTLEHAYDVDATLAEVRRVLSDAGTLIAAIPSDARNPRYLVDNHTWKTAPHDVQLRLRAAGLRNVELEEIDVLRGLRQGPYPPARDQMMFVRAWKRVADITAVERATEASAWVYGRLDPAQPAHSNDAREVLAGGFAFCAGYAVVIGELLRREGITVSWVTMEASGHDRGRGPELRDTHTVVAAILDGREHVVDAMSNVIIPHPLLDVIAKPALVTVPDDPDERWRERGYALYATDYWYSRVRRFQRHRSLNPKLRRWHKAPN
jgi:SAM-dependent methyltransferase